MSRVPPPPPDDRPIVDETKETYIVGGQCSNCGTRFRVKCRKGDSTPLSVECPHCEVTIYRWYAGGRA